MLFDIPFIADWKKTGEHRQLLTDRNTARENEGRIDYDYQVGQKVLILGGPVEKMCFFQMAPIPLLSVLIYSNRSQYVILKVSLKKIEQNLPVGCVKH